MHMQQQQQQRHTSNSLSIRHRHRHSRQIENYWQNAGRQFTSRRHWTPNGRSAYLQLSNASFYWSRNEQMAHKPHRHCRYYPLAGKKFCIIYVGAGEGLAGFEGKQRTSSTRPTDLNAIALKYVVRGQKDTRKGPKRRYRDICTCNRKHP